MKGKIRIVIADDHPIFRKGLIDIIKENSQFEILSEAVDGEQALSYLQSYKPDIAILDINMPKMTGFDVVRTLKDSVANLKIVFLTMHKEEDIFNRAMDLGVKGYVLKECAADDIIECLTTVAGNQHYISPSISEYLFNRNKKSNGVYENIGLAKLSPTEITILKLISEGKTSKEIADLLFISRKTVENHRVNICSKLCLHGVNTLMKFAIENKHLF